MMEAVTLLHSETTLGKRKTLHENHLVLHLASSPDPSDILSRERHSSPPILVNGKLVPATKRRYKCTYDDCQKSYTKPSRLTEHKRSHTGQRPFVCETCQKSYLRETHLQAHIRSHLPESSRPLSCPEENCTKRFWTRQHLRVHIDWHNGSKPFQCSAAGCNEKFMKNNQLRVHICSAHAPPGTKPYECEHEGCTKTFSTKQHLRTHLKTHDTQRYTCVQPTCLPDRGNAPAYYPTWTALQSHMYTAHPPTCSHSSCNGRTFSSYKGLRAHQKLHEQREIEREMGVAITTDGDDANAMYKRRRGGEIDRDWKCDIDGCGKDFKSKKALMTHTNVTHLGRRDYICPHENCRRTFGYKHLLQRHLAKIHTSAKPSDDDENIDSILPSRKGSLDDTKSHTYLDIDTITGNSYAQRARANVASAMALLCPYPQQLDELVFTTSANDRITGVQDNQEGRSNMGQHSCEYAFSRAYDLRRHLKAVHGLDVVRESVDEWVKERKAAAQNSM